MPSTNKVSTCSPTTSTLRIYFPFASKCWQQWWSCWRIPRRQAKGRTAALSQLHRRYSHRSLPRPHLCALHSITAHRALSAAGTRLRHRLIRRTGTAGKAQQNPLPAWTALQASLGNTPRRYTHTLCKNTKHNGESFPPLAGKGYSLRSSNMQHCQIVTNSSLNRTILGLLLHLYFKALS